jgi:hypothetical protein
MPSSGGQITKRPEEGWVSGWCGQGVLDAPEVLNQTRQELASVAYAVRLAGA